MKVRKWPLINRPKKLENLLRKEGLKGNSYRILYGDMKDIYGMIKESDTIPINDALLCWNHQEIWKAFTQ